MRIGICYNQRKEFAGCGHDICCFYCDKIQECNICCEIVDNFEGHENPIEECKYCKEELKMKRQETLDIENKLNEILTDRHRNSSFGYYGCEEVTIGFANNGHGNEIVDFMSMDSKGIIRCYEIKVIMADLKSKAKKSWYGHYNYLVIGGELLNKIEEVKLLTPKEIGILDSDLKSIRKPKLKGIHDKTETMLKESLVRSMYHKMNKYKRSQDIDEYKKLESKLKRAERERKKIYKEYRDLTNDIWKYERWMRSKGIEFYLYDEIEKMKGEIK